VLEKAGFGKRLIGWVRRIYSSAVSCVKINGVVTNVFKLGRSVRQGCPLSAMLYALSAEPLATLLRQNRYIKGVEVPGGGVSLVYQYADDTTITVKDRESVREVLKTVSLYGRASGARVNLDKSEIMYIGQVRDRICDIGLKENKDYFRVLGINLGIKDVEGRDRQYVELINGIVKTLRFWKMRGLKLRGKIAVVNGLIMSRSLYIMTVLDV